MYHYITKVTIEHLDTNIVTKPAEFNLNIDLDITTIGTTTFAGNSF